jgi:Ca2+-transporting ATPase
MTPAEGNTISDAPWARRPQEVLQALSVTAAEGLDKQEAKKRRRKYGPNRLRSAKRKSAWAILAEQFRSLLVLLLAVAAALLLVFVGARLQA